jgi:predicted NBD/HSP70 family sugar kinase/DNA-binding transcriptional ArsR family regulator
VAGDEPTGPVIVGRQAAAREVVGWQRDVQPNARVVAGLPVDEPPAQDRAAAGGQAALRRQNLSRALREVHFGGPLSRSDLASRLGVNRSTVGSLVSELAERGLVTERAPVARMAPGRPSPVVEPRPDGPVVLATEFATDSLAAAVVGLGGTIVRSRRVDRTRAWRSPTDTVNDLADVAIALLAADPADPLPGLPLLAVGVSIPGLVRRDDGFVHIAPNLGWHDAPLAQLMRDRLRLGVPVLVGNDADLATLAEHTRGAGMGRADFICLWGEAGMGAGIVAGGRRLTGSAGYAGEVGHMPVNPDGIACHCGSRGCWETEVGEDALLRNAGMRSEGGGRAALEALFAAADRGDGPALMAIDTVGRWLGVGLAGLVNIFNPSGVALGGLYARLYPYVFQTVAQAMDERTMPALRDGVEVIPAALGTDSALLGAAELAFGPTIADPTMVPRRGTHYRRPAPSEVALGRNSMAQDQGGEPAAQRTA